MAKPYKTVTLRLNASQYGHLQRQSEASGLKMEPLLRQLIMGVNLRPRPPDTYAALLRELCQVTPEADRLFKRAFDKFGFSARSYNRVLKVARTIADLEESDMVEAPHAAEAVQYRSLDRKYWNRHR